jgi:hypothetical protein
VQRGNLDVSLSLYHLRKQESYRLLLIVNRSASLVGRNSPTLSSHCTLVLVMPTLGIRTLGGLILVLKLGAQKD